MVCFNGQDRRPSKQPPFRQSLWLIQPQQLCCRPTHYGNRRDVRSIKSKMIIPAVAARMEKQDCLTSLPIDSGDIASFIAITRDASKRQILPTGEATMFAADYVIDLMWKARVLLTDQTVFAAMIRAPGDSLRIS